MGGVPTSIILPSSVPTTVGRKAVPANKGGGVPNRFTSVHAERRVYPVTNVMQLTALSGPGASASVPVSLAYDASGSVEVRSVDFVTGQEVTPWATIGNLSGGLVSGTFNMREYKGWQKLQARVAGQIVSEGATRIGAGLIVGIDVCQSQGRLFIANSTSGGTVAPNDLISAYGKSGLLGGGSGGEGTMPAFGATGWYWQGENAAVVDGIQILGGGSDGAAACGNALVDALNVPVAFVANAAGGLSIAQINFAGNTSEAIARYVEVDQPHYIVSFSHGSADVGAGTTQAIYLAGLETARSNRLANAKATPRRKWVVTPLGRQGPDSNPGTQPARTQAIRAAQLQFVAAHADDTIIGSSNFDMALNSGDALHFAPGVSGYVSAGLRLAATLLSDLGKQVPSAVGPKLLSATRSGATFVAKFTLGPGDTLIEKLDVTGSTLQPNGFSIRRASNAASLTILTINITGADEITFTVSSDPAEQCDVLYGTVASPGLATVGGNGKPNGLTRSSPFQYSFTGVRSAPELLPANSRTAFVGDSNVQGSLGSTPAYPWLNYSGARLFGPVGANKGVAGDTIDDVNARLAAIWALNAAMIFYSVGRNSITAGQTLSQMQASYTTFYDAAFAQAATKYVIQPTLYKRAVDGVNWTSSHETLRQQVNAWLLSQHGRNDGRLRIVDVENVGDNVSTMRVADGQHLNVLGSYTLGKPVGLVAKTLLEAASVLYTSDPLINGQLLATGRTLAGTTGTKSDVTPGANTIVGDAATNTTFEIPAGLAGATFTLSKEVDASGRNVQVIDVSGTVTTAGDFRFRINGSGNWTAGTVFESYIGAKLENLSGVGRFYCGTAYGSSITPSSSVPRVDDGDKMQGFSSGDDFVLTSYSIGLPQAATLIQNCTTFRLEVGPVSGRIKLYAPTTRLAPS